MTAEKPVPDADCVPQEERIAKAFAPFGWAVTDDFKREYETVSTVYHLTNGLVALAEENDRLRARIDGPESESQR